MGTDLSGRYCKSVQLSSRKFYYSKQRLSRKFNIVKAHVNHLLVGVVSRSLLLTNVNNSLAFCKRFAGGQVEQEKETSLCLPMRPFHNFRL